MKVTIAHTQFKGVAEDETVMGLTVSVESDTDELSMYCVIDQLVRPALKAIGYDESSVDRHLDDGLRNVS